MCYWSRLRDLVPVIRVICFFQWVVVGLTRFVRGLEMGLFPVGEAKAYAFARRGNLTWLLIFAFALGFGTTGGTGTGRSDWHCQPHR